MAFLDHQGESEFPFAKETVFNAMLKAIPTVKGMKVDNADKLQGRIVVKAGVSLMSWGENIPILLSEVAENRTQVKITSSPKTGVMFGGAFDLGKNRKNIEQILSATSRFLSSSTSQPTQNITNPRTTNTFQQTQNFQQNTNMENQQIDKKWYDNKFVTHLLLVIFFPVGLYALWKSRTIAKWWKITATVIIGLIVIANFGDDEKTSNNSTTSNSEQISNESNSDKTKKLTEVKSNWNYSTDEDKMSGDKRFFATTQSTNEIEFEFPYNGGSTFKLIVRNMGKGNEVLMTVSKGQFMTSIMSSEKCRIKFDDGKAMNFSFNSANDASMDVIFFNSTNKLITKLKIAKKVMIEAPFYDAGRQIIYFDVEGLNWDK